MDTEQRYGGDQEMSSRTSSFRAILSHTLLLKASWKQAVAMLLDRKLMHWRD